MTPPVDPQRGRRLQKIFLAACEVEPEARSSFLDRECGADHALRVELEALLAEDSPDGPLATGESPLSAEGMASLISPAPDSIGPYRILSRLGEGGMGVVYEAEQQHPRRRVALKVLHPHVSSERSLRRFELEAEVLGRLRHPGIVPVYEAGVADTGSGPQPYFAMELVDGPTLLEHARSGPLPIRARLELMARICDAVQHAHQKGVIHRDLKPGNILVDGEGRPRVLDFGIARCVDEELHLTATAGTLEGLVGTLPYMSPEQVGGDSRDLDTRSDVYALGVLAYELVSGRRPYDLERRSLAEAARVIADVDPDPLSSVDRTFRGDLETIVSKALEKERDRRYGSAAELGMDLRRFLANEPIVARPASTFYQVRKFARRNRPVVISILAAFVLLTGSLIYAGLGWASAEEAAEEARQEAETAYRVEEFLVGLFEVSDPYGEYRGGELRAKDLLQRGAAQIMAELEAEPEIRARLLHVLGRLKRILGMHAEAETLLRRAWEERARDLGETHPDTLFSAAELSSLLHDQGDTNQAEQLLRESLRLALAAHGRDHWIVPPLECNLAILCWERGALEEAEELSRSAFEATVALDAGEDSGALSVLNNLALALAGQGRLEEAEVILLDCVERTRAEYGEKSPHLLSTRGNLATLYRTQGRLQEAETLSREILWQSQEVLGAEHPDTLIRKDVLALCLLDLGRFEEAEVMFRSVFEISSRVLGRDHPTTLTAQGNLTLSLQGPDSNQEAEALHRDLCARNLRLLGPDHPDTILADANLATMISDLGRLEEARVLLRDALDRGLDQPAVEQEHLLTFESNLGLLLLDLGRIEEAEVQLRSAWQRSRRVFGEDHPATWDMVGQWASLLREKGELEEAERHLREALAGFEAWWGPDHFEVLYLRGNLAFLLQETERLDEAEELLRQAAHGSRLRNGPHHELTLEALADLADLYRSTGRLEEAEEILERIERAQAPPAVPEGGQGGS